MASVVELEGAKATDRKGVAGVFYNRLNSSAYPVSYTHLDVYKRQPLYVYNGVGLSHYITVSGYSYTASFGDSDWYQYLYYVDPYRANYGNGTTYGEHQDTVSNVFSSVNHTYGIVIH